MKWVALAIFAVLAAVPATVSAQEAVQIGHIVRVEDKSPTWWAMSGYEMIHLTQSDGDDTPVTRSLRFDARTVEILSRVQSPPLRAGDIRTVSRNGHDYIVVRRYLLAEVLPQDARAVGMSKAALARKWVTTVRRGLPQVAPQPGRFGILS